MGDADEFHPPTERNKDLPVLEPDRPRGPEARHAEAYELVEENAAVRSAFLLPVLKRLIPLSGIKIFFFQWFGLYDPRS
jgi:hypothetical protein